MQWEADGPWEQICVVLGDLVPCGEHPHGRGGVAAPAVGLVHDRLQVVDPADVGPVPLLWEVPALAPLQEAGLRWHARRLLPQHVAVEPRAAAPDTGVGIHLAHGPAVPLGHGARAPAELQHGELLVECRNPVALGRAVQALAAGSRCRGARRAGQRGWGMRLGVARHLLLHGSLRGIVAAEARAVCVTVPAHHGLTAVGHVVLFVRLGGVGLEGEVGEREEAQAAHVDLEALVVHHCPIALCTALSHGNVGVDQRHAQLRLRSEKGDCFLGWLLFLLVRARMPARGALLAQGTESEAPLADNLMAQAVHWQVAKRNRKRKGQDEMLLHWGTHSLNGGGSRKLLQEP
mmetsp:Transcript_140141/g.390732  ORF Transcript_140141/g.390732 Transcript_140141/m.390732 type:complete len:347 (+) Transcript_140141:723-1763(+)